MFKKNIKELEAIKNVSVFLLHNKTNQNLATFICSVSRSNYFSCQLTLLKGADKLPCCTLYETLSALQKKGVRSFECAPKDKEKNLEYFTFLFFNSYEDGYIYKADSKNVVTELEIVLERIV